MVNIDKWGMDIYQVGALSSDRPLTVVTYTVLRVRAYSLLYTLIKYSLYAIYLLTTAKYFIGYCSKITYTCKLQTPCSVE